MFDQNPSTLSFITPTKGQALLVMNEHLYKCNKKTAKKKYWICVVSSCKVYVHTTLEDSYLSGGINPHDHAPNPDLIEVKKIRQQIKKRVIDEITPVGMIYDEEMAKVSMSTSALAILLTSHGICTCASTLLRVDSTLICFRSTVGKGTSTKFTGEIRFLFVHPS